MHRLVYSKLKAKALAEHHRSAGKQSKDDVDTSPASDDLPILELSLPDSKSFRASVILPDLSRRFTLLRTNGELLPINNFQQRLRHERESGYITQQDESILLQQYRQQYLSEKQSTTSPLDYQFLPISPPSKNLSPPVSPMSKKPSCKAINGLFSASPSARDAAYIRRVHKMSTTSESPSQTRPHTHSPVAIREKLVDPIDDDVPDNWTLSNRTDRQPTAQLGHTPRALSLDSVNEEWEAEDVEAQVTPTQLHRLSVTMDRILESHLEEGPQAVGPVPDSYNQFNPCYPQTEDYNPTTSAHVFNAALTLGVDAEARLHDELSKALSDEAASMIPLSSGNRHQFPSERPLPQGQSFLKAGDDPSRSCDSRPPSPISATLSEFTPSSPSLDEGLEVLDRCSYIDGTSDLDDSLDGVDPIESLLPTLDRNKLLSFFDLHYDELLFVQEALVSPAHVPRLRSRNTQNENQNRLLESPIPALSSSHLLGSHPQSLERNHSVSTCLSATTKRKSSLSRPGRSPRSLSSVPKTSRLSPNPKTAPGIGSCHKMRMACQSSDRVRSPIQSSSHGSQNQFPVLVSPSSTDSPDCSSFPVTPPAHQLGRSPVLRQSCIPSPPMSSDPATAANIEARPRKLNSRTGRPIPTTILFRDVEAQAVAANFALNKLPVSGPDGLANGKKPASRKKVISIAQIGAPKLVSASANFPGLQLEEAGFDKNATLQPQRTIGHSKGGFKLRLKKKRPSEGTLNLFDHHSNANLQPEAPPKAIKATESTPNLRRLNADSNGAPHEQAHDCAMVSPSRTSRHHSRDQIDLSSAWKAPTAFTSLRKLMGRRRKSSLSSVVITPGELEAQSATNSIHALIEVPSPRAIPPLRINKNQLESGPEGEEAAAWSSSTPKFSPPHSVTQLFHDLGLPPAEGSSCESDQVGRAISPAPPATPLSYPLPIQAATDYELDGLPSSERATKTSAVVHPPGLRSGGHHNDGHQLLPKALVGQCGPSDEITKIPIHHLVLDPIKFPQGSNLTTHDLPPVHIIGSVDSVDQQSRPQSDTSELGLANPVVGLETGSVKGDLISNLSVPTPRSAHLGVKRSDHSEGQSDYASSILDLYGGDSPASPSSRARFSSVSIYSVGVNLSRSSSTKSRSNPHLGSQSRSITGNQVEPLPPMPSLSLPTSPNTTPHNNKEHNGLDPTPENEVMVMVQQLQSSTRYSSFDDPARLSLDMNDDDDDEEEQDEEDDDDDVQKPSNSFINHIVPRKDQLHGIPIGGSPIQRMNSPLDAKTIRSPVRNRIKDDDDDDDDDEAAVWKQILEG